MRRPSALALVRKALRSAGDPNVGDAEFRRLASLTLNVVACRLAAARVRRKIDETLAAYCDARETTN